LQDRYTPPFPNNHNNNNDNNNNYNDNNTPDSDDLSTLGDGLSDSDKDTLITDEEINLDTSILSQTF
jgi:hypothetical protein